MSTAKDTSGVDHEVGLRPNQQQEPDLKREGTTPEGIALLRRLVTLLPPRLAVSYSSIVERLLQERERHLSTIAALSGEIADLRADTALATPQERETA